MLCWELFSGTRAYAGLRAPNVVYLVMSDKAPLQLPDGAPAGYQVGICGIKAESCIHCAAAAGLHSGVCPTCIFRARMQPVKLRMLLHVTVQALMQNCLTTDPQQRPTFTGIVASLNTLLEQQQASRT